MPDLSAPDPARTRTPAPTRLPSIGARIGVALLAAGVAVALTVALTPLLARAVFLLAFAAVTVAAWYGGWAAGTIAAVLCVLGIDYWVIPPVGALRPTSAADVVPMAGFIGVALLIGRANEAVRAARDAATGGATALEEANAKLARALADAVEARTEAAAARDAATLAASRLHEAVAQAPAAVSLSEGPEHRYVLVNARATDVVGRHDLVGRTYAEAFPLLAAQGFGALLDQVYATGEPYAARAARVLVPKPDGAAVEAFYDFVYQPLRDAQGRVTGILQHAVDVTEAVRARDALAASETRARLAVEAAQLGTWTWELATDTVTCDARVRELFGLPDDAPPWRMAVLAERVHADDRARVATAFAAAADPGGAGRFEATCRVVRPDGTERWALASGQMTFAGAAAERRPVSLFGTVRDVSAQYAAEAAARAAEARFRAVQDASPDGSVLVESVREPATPDGTAGPIVDFVYTYANPAAERLTGRTADDLLGRRVLELFPHVRSEGLFDAYVRVVETGEPFVTETEYQHDGMDHGLRVTAVRVGDGFHIQFADVTARIRAAREAARAREAAERTAARAGALQHLTAALAAARTVDAVAEVVVTQVVAVTGAKTGAFIVRPPGASAGLMVRHEALPEGVRARFATIPLDAPGPAAAALRSGTPAFVGSRAALETRYPEIADVWRSLDVEAVATVPLAVGGEDGEPLVIGAMSYTFAAPRSADADEEAFFLALGRQAALALERVRLLETEQAARREAEAARAAAESARRAAEAANQAKGAFLSTMSHELRTPLNAIAGYAELLALGLRGPLTEAQRQDLERLRRANQHMSGLVEAVLTFARVEAGQVDYRCEAVPLAPLLADVEALVAPQLAARALTYTHDACGPDTPDRPHVVHADAEKVRQILLNLVTNAIKFTEPGGRVSLGCEHDRAARVIRVRVTDTGRGIAADQLERVFQPFVQVDRARIAASQQGVGLGLAISRDLARGMGGDLVAESTPGTGSTFTLTLPAV